MHIRILPSSKVLQTESNNILVSNGVKKEAKD